MQTFSRRHFLLKAELLLQLEASVSFDTFVDGAVKVKLLGKS